MTPHPRLSGAGIELVKRFEGFRPRALRLDGGGWTIGYGHTASAREGAQVTEAEGEALLIYDLDRVAQPASAEEPDPIDEAVQGLTTRFRALFPDEAPPPPPSEPTPTEATPSEPAPSALTPSEPAVTAAEPDFSPPPPPERASGPAPLEASDPDLRSWPVERSPRRRRRSGPPVLVLLVGAAGAAMFVVALLAMIYGRATVANLAVGLMGVVCMVPAGVVLLARAFGERPDL